MKKVIILSLSLISYITTSVAQTSNSELTLITETLVNYIHGTSYNEYNQINSAFYPEANLYLDGKEGKMNVVPISTYAGYFKDGEQGAFTGRMGRILSIDYFGNIAQAKVEILIPARNKRYIDMFILKIVEGHWKIISKTANSEKSDNRGDKVLFVTSNAEHYGSTDINTGNSFKEIVIAYDEFTKAGYIVDVISPNGGAVPLAYINTSNELEKRYIYNNDFMYAMGHTYSPSEVKAEDYKAIYFVGGGSAVFGVPDNLAIQELAISIYEDHKGVVSAVCHGSAGIVNLKTKDGKYIYHNKNVSGYPDDYENKEKEYYKQFPLHIQESIEDRGGSFKYSERNTPYVEVDGRLITGQNHLSAKGVALAIIDFLNR